MVILEAGLVIALLAALVYGTILLLTRPPGQRSPASRAGKWRTTHYDVKRETRVVLQKISPSGRDVIDEHVLASIRVDDPEYDAKFLVAMSEARERRALFESEESD